MIKPSKIIFAGAAGQLEGLLHLPDVPPRAIVVIAHPLPTMGGTMENKIVTTLAKTFAELGFAALRFNFRGVGASVGVFDDGNGEMQDAMAAAEFMRDQFPDLPLVLAGFSFGGYVQARAAMQLQPIKLVLVAPAVGRFAMPVVPLNTLLIHGEMDEVIPLSDVLDWARPPHLPLVVLPEAGHFFHGRLPQIKQIVLNEFNGCL
ncbi:MAG: alpha/beta hydrolase [Gallionella sp.]